MFRRYLRCELETLSPRTLALYAREVRRAREEGRNPVLERHDWLAGYLASTPGTGMGPPHARPAAAFFRQSGLDAFLVKQL